MDKKQYRLRDIPLPERGRILHNLTGVDFDLISGLFRKETEAPLKILDLLLDEVEKKISEEVKSCVERKERLNKEVIAVEFVMEKICNEGEIYRALKAQPNKLEGFIFEDLDQYLTLFEWAMCREYLKDLFGGKKYIARNLMEVVRERNIVDDVKNREDENNKRIEQLEFTLKKIKLVHENLLK